MKINDLLKVSCGDGQMFNDSDAATKDVRCGEDGTWSMEDPGKCQGKSDSDISSFYLFTLTMAKVQGLSVTHSVGLGDARFRFSFGLVTMQPRQVVYSGSTFQ